MISKVITGFDNNLQYTTLLNVGSKGFDRQQLRKVAASEAFVFAPEFERRPGEAYLHIISVGAGETYGANKNADFYNKEARVVHSADGKKSLQLRDGLRGYHSTFLKFGAVYEEHVNSTKNGTPKGRIAAETFNPIMNRGELIVAVPENDWRSDLQKLATGGDLRWSIGCGVDADFCSICLNRAPTRKHYCGHMKYAARQVLDSGHQVFVYNDKPYFHDISKVKNPAELIAFTLAKVASADGDLVVPGRIPLLVAHKLAGHREQRFLDILQKLAEMEKEVECKATPLTEGLCDACHLPEDAEQEIESKLKDVPTDAILSASKRQMLVPPRVFIKVVLHRPDEEATKAEAELPGVFQELLDNPNLSEFLDDSTYLGEGSRDSRLRDLEPLLSLNDEPVRKRILIISSGGAPRHKEASQRPQTVTDAGAKALAAEYAKYQLAWLSNQNDYNRYIPLVVATNRG